ncbi:hypothetical protein [Campylobacter rectus]|uniref:Uncharacterized protein n=2 Tax=Campylobacter rectus TaxID=203 RepID=A0A6G5QQD6_CAMRE|nr:hypothetical protein [Campylobacter rectus]QCD47831.1 hypothetical protein CRECT_2241 [Campylobacter rectus]UEB48526.1 hypothetical protein LK437_04250 [Campylobacter rectus]
MIERANMGVWGSNFALLTREASHFEAIKFDEFWLIWQRLKFAEMKFDFAKYAANGSAVKFGF